MPLYLATRDASPRKGFTLTELLVAVAIILVLVSLIGAAVSNVRASQKRTATQDLIRKLDAIVTRQFRTYDCQSAPPLVLSSTNAPLGTVFTAKSEKRAWHLRRNLLSGDMPDRWTDVAALASGTTVAFAFGASVTLLPVTRQQRNFANIWTAASPRPTATFAGAECLFMIVMQSGIADPIELRNLGPIGDKDGDGFMEFLDAWGNPIGYILWPYAVQLPGGSGQRFYSGSRTPLPVLREDLNSNGLLDPGEADYNSNGLADSPSATLGMRPLIYSAGPDGEYGFERNDEASNLLNDPLGASCGDWTQSPTATSAGPTSSFATDNLTNFDNEAKP